MNIRVVVMKNGTVRIFNEGIITTTVEGVTRADMGDTVIDLVMEQCVAHGIAPDDGDG